MQTTTNTNKYLFVCEVGPPHFYLGTPKYL